MGDIQHIISCYGYRMVPQKNMGLEKVWTDLEILEMFVMGLEVLSDFTSGDLNFETILLPLMLSRLLLLKISIF